MTSHENKEFAYNNLRFARLSNTPSGRDVREFEDKFLLNTTLILKLALS